VAGGGWPVVGQKQPLICAAFGAPNRARISETAVCANLRLLLTGHNHRPLTTDHRPPTTSH
jgi:hypothetical protein